MPGDDEILARLGVPAAAAPTPATNSDDEILSRLGVQQVQTAQAPTGGDAAILSRLGVSAPEPAKPEPQSGPSISQPSAAQTAADEAAAGKARFDALPLGEKVARNLKRQFMEGVTPTVISAAARAAGIDALAKPELSMTEKYSDLGTVGNLGTGAVAFAADPLGQMIFSGAGKAITKVPGVSRIFSSAAELMGERQAAAVAVKQVGEVADDAYRAAARRYILNKVAREAVKGSAEFGAYSATSEAARQADAEDLDPLTFTRKTLEGSVFGGLMGGVLAAPLKSEATELFGASRKAIVQGKLTKLIEDQRPPRIAAELDAEAENLSTAKDALTKKLDQSYGKLDEVTKAKLQQQLDTVNGRLTSLQQGPPTRPEAPASFDQATQRAAVLDSNIEALKAEREGLQKQAQLIVHDPNRLTLGTDDIAALNKIEKRTATIDKQVDQHLERLDKTSTKAVEAESRGVKSTMAYQLALDEHNRQLEELLHQQKVLQHGLTSPYSSVDAASRDGEQMLGRAAKLVDVSARLEQVQQGKQQTLASFRNFLHESGPLSLQSRLDTKFETRPAFLDRAYGYADEAAQKLVDKGAIKPEQKSGYAQNLFLELAERKKLPLGKSGVPKSEWLRQFTQRTELFNQADKELGTRLVDTHYDAMQAATRMDHWNVDESKQGHLLIQSLQKRGLPPTEITNLLTHVESGEGGVPVFNPQAVESKALTRQAYEGKIPADKVLAVYPELGALRQEMDRLYGLATEGGRRDVGYAPGYVKLMPKQGVSQAPSMGPNVTAITDAASYKERFGGQFDPQVHENDPHVWFQSYVREINRDRAFAPVLPGIFKQLTLANLVGDGTAAREFSKTMTRALGLNFDREMSQQFANQLAAANETEIRAMMRAANLAPSAFDEVLKGVRDSMYQAQVVLKLRNFMLDYLQPFLIGSAEVGANNIRRAYNAVLFNSKLRAFSKQFDHDLLGADAAITHELGVEGPQTAVGKTVQKVIALPGRVTGLRAVQSASETLKRRVTFLAGYMQYKEAVAKGGGALVDQALDGLLEGERSRVLRIMAENGPEAAAQAYGIIRSYRANFALSAINKPEILNSKLGQLVPFTTWSTNQLARMVTDVRRTHGFAQGIDWLSGSGPTAATNTKQLVARIVQPLVVLAALRAATGQSIPNAHPVNDLAGAANWQILPMVTGPITQANKYGAAAGLRSAVQNMPVAYQVDQYKKRLAKTGSRVSALFGTDPVYGTPVQKALDPIKKLFGH